MKAKRHSLAHHCSLYDGALCNHLSQPLIVTIYHILVEQSSIRQLGEYEMFHNCMYRRDVFDGCGILEWNIAHCHSL